MDKKLVWKKYLSQNIKMLIPFSSLSSLVCSLRNYTDNILKTELDKNIMPR